MKVNVKLGRNIKRNRFDLSHDVNTTADFGFCQPLFSKEMMPNSSMSVKLNSVVRLAPMPVPTYGHIDYRTYHQFVPYNEIFEPIDNLLSGQSYGTSSKSYVPTKVPSSELYILSSLLFRHCYMTIYKLENGEYKMLPKSLSGEVEVGTYIKDFISTFLHVVGNSFIPGVNSRYPYVFVKDDSIDTARRGYNNPFYSYKFAPVTFEDADYILQDQDKTIYCLKLNKYGSNLRKILLGLGYQIDFWSTTKVSLLPLFSYFKVWFDIFAPKRDVIWTDTPAFKILDYFREIGSIDLSYFFSDENKTELIVSFVDDLANCYYVDDTDYISAHTVKTSSSISGVPKVLGPGGSEQGQPSLGQDEQPYVYASGPIGGAELSMLNRLYKWVNKNTAIGSNIYKFLNTHFGATDVALEDSNKIGTNITDIQIGDVMSLAGNPGESLGQFAGKGFGYDQGQFMTFESKTFGIWITLAVVVPHGGYTQGLDYNLTHIGRFDFPTPEFDSLGFQVSNKDVVYSSREVYSEDSVNIIEPFGYIPRYFEQKVKNNILNGDMSRRSTRASFLPYTLDKFISPEFVSYSVNQRTLAPEGVSRPSRTETFYTGVKLKGYSLPASGTVWRFIGRNPWLQNFDRVFNNSGSFDDKDLISDINDNFIIHNYIECYCEQPLLPVSESFETDGQSDNNVVVEKA